MAHSFGTLDELGDNYGFRKVRAGPRRERVRRERDRLPARLRRASSTTTTSRTSCTSCTAGRAVRGGGETYASCRPAGSSTSSRRRIAVVERLGDDELVLVSIGGKDGYVGATGSS